MNDVFPLWGEGEGIFSTLTNTPWQNTISSASLDVAYHGAYAGARCVAPMILRQLDDDGTLPKTHLTNIGSTLSALYRQKWQSLWDMYNTELPIVNPISETESYTVSVTENLERAVAGTDSNDRTTTDKDRVTETSSGTTTTDMTKKNNDFHQTSHTGKDTTTYGHKTETVTDDDGKSFGYGFNTEEGSPVPNSMDTQDTTVTVTESGEDSFTPGVTDSITTNDTETNKGTVDEIGASTTTSDRSGTIKDTGLSTEDTTEEKAREETHTRTKQYRDNRLLEYYEALRVFWVANYFAEVFNDINSMCTLAIYPEYTVY